MEKFHLEKDKILRYLIEQLRGEERETIQVTYENFKRAFKKDCKSLFYQNLLNSIAEDGLFIMEDNRTHYNTKYTVTAKGYDFYDAGGYTQQYEDSQLEKDHESRERLLLHWKVKWFSASIIMSIIALLISVLGLIFG